MPIGPKSFVENPDDYAGLLMFMLISTLGSIIIPLLYNTLFVGKFAATPGKMVLGLKFVLSDGSRISYGRAALRYLAETISGIIFLMGYIMAAWDEERRTLHDRLCNTRVIK
ncbi:RDD family protein [bacterium]|nr:RDD family protein [bacterium]